MQGIFTQANVGDKVILTLSNNTPASQGHSILNHYRSGVHHAKFSGKTAPTYDSLFSYQVMKATDQTVAVQLDITIGRPGETPDRFNRDKALTKEEGLKALAAYREKLVAELADLDNLLATV